MSITKIYTDACCKIPNANEKGRLGKGKSTCGIIILSNNEEHLFSKCLGEMTVPEAEFNGLIFALDKASNFTREEIEVWMDSELVVKWMNGDYRMKKDHIKPLFDEAKKFSNRFKSVKYFHHSREQEYAKKADKLADEEYKRNYGK